jgi:hypothetical protein
MEGREAVGSGPGGSMQVSLKLFQNPTLKVLLLVCSKISWSIWPWRSLLPLGWSVFFNNLYIRVIMPLPLKGAPLEETL